MKIKVVTDSTADLPPQLAKELGITIGPVYLRFGLRWECTPGQAYYL